MARRLTRRKFIQASALAGVGFYAAGGISSGAVRDANSELNIACIGVGGKGDSDSSQAGKLGKIVAICDIDEKHLDKKAEKFSTAKKYFDFRKMLDEMGKEIDAVVVSTPDHTHAVAAMMAIKMKKH